MCPDPWIPIFEFTGSPGEFLKHERQGVETQGIQISRNKGFSFMKTFHRVGLREFQLRVSGGTVRPKEQERSSPVAILLLSVGP